MKTVSVSHWIDYIARQWRIAKATANPSNFGIPGVKPYLFIISPKPEYKRRGDEPPHPYNLAFPVVGTSLKDADRSFQRTLVHASLDERIDLTKLWTVAHRLDASDEWLKRIDKLHNPQRNNDEIE